MKALHIHTTSLNNIFEQLHQEFGGQLKADQNEFLLELDNELVEGKISGMAFKGNISYISYDVVFAQDLKLVFHSSNSQPLYFVYCSEGELTHAFGDSGSRTDIQNFQTGIFSNASAEANVFTFIKDEPCHTTFIAVNTKNPVDSDQKNDQINYELKRIFDAKQANGQFGYVSSFNLKIEEQIRQLGAVSQTGIVRRLLTKGIVHMILAMEVQQHSMDVKNLSENNGTLTKSEMETIKELSEFIKNYPELQYSLKYLSNKSGLAPSKLQEGFKLLHDRTVTDYIRNVRVEAAENLIKTTDMNISEVVYSIGLTSRSYFSKIFKEKYNCSPKYYQDHQNTLAVTA